MVHSRREFVKLALVAGAGTRLAPSRASAAPSSFPTPTSTKGKDRFHLEPAQQLDLPHRAGLAIHCLTSLLDERQDYLPYFDVHYNARPPVANHIRWDYGDQTGRAIDALRLARIMNGQTQGLDRDAALQKWSERLLGEHGLSWWPDPPYKNPHPSTQPRRLADVAWTQRSTLAALTTQFMVTGEQRYADLARRQIDGLNHLALWHDGMAYFPREAGEIRTGDVLYPPEGWSGRSMSTAGWFGAILGVLLWPLARFGALTGYEPAIRLGRGLAEYTLRGAKVFRPDGRFSDMIQGHYYARSATAGGLLRLGVLIGNEEYVQMAERAYNHAKEWGTSFGWFPEDFSRPGCETCCITDVIETAIGLGLHVDAKYWNDAERFGRNHLLESQLLRIDWLDEFHKGREPYTLPVENPDPAQISHDHPLERSLGGFAGWSGVNDWVSSRPQTMACCHANGTRGLYNLWHYGVTQAGNRVSVNMLFSRTTEDVGVKSHLPFTGRVDIQCRSDRRIRVRVPDYVPGESLSVEINGRPTPMRSARGWVQLPPTKKGDVAVVRFGLPERKESVHIGYNTWEVKYRGDTVTAISPRGKYYPLYERQWVSSPPDELPIPAPPMGLK